MEGLREVPVFALALEAEGNSPKVTQLQLLIQKADNFVPTLAREELKDKVNDGISSALIMTMYSHSTTQKL